jgi:hypothetical protein
MMVHKLIDVLLAGGSKGFVIVPGSDLPETIRLLRLAEKFDFGEIHLELGSNFHPSGYQMMKVPELTDVENDFLDEGLVPLPAPLCWYEFSLNGFKSGILVKEGWIVTRIDYDWEQGTGCMDGIWVWTDKEGDFKATVNNKLQEGYIQYNHQTAIGNWGISRYFTLMLNSKTTEIEVVRGVRRPAGKKSLSKREPLPDHRIVRIVPRAYIAARRAEGESLRCSPRLHWRRSHLRTLADGRKIVISRFLVGKADIGVVSHEYRVQLSSE